MRVFLDFVKIVDLVSEIFVLGLGIVMVGRCLLFFCFRVWGLVG